MYEFWTFRAFSPVRFAQCYWATSVRKYGKSSDQVRSDKYRIPLSRTLNLRPRRRHSQLEASRRRRRKLLFLEHQSQQEKCRTRPQASQGPTARPTNGRQMRRRRGEFQAGQYETSRSRLRNALGAVAGIGVLLDYWCVFCTE